MLSAKHTILLADDDEEVRLGVADLLLGLGLEVFQAQDGMEAVDLVRERAVDLALLDYQMPGCSGLEALPLIHSHRSELPCIFYSGRLNAEIERMAFAAGAFAVLKKPVQPVLLRSEVRRALGLEP